MVQIASPSRVLRWRRAHALSALVWAVAGASAAFWVWQWPSVSPRSDLQWADARSPQAGSDPALLERVLSGGAAEGDPDSPATAPAAVQGLVLQGVIARAGSQGLAVLASGAQPTRAFEVGQSVAPGWVLGAVGPRSATLRATDASRREQLLQLPERPGSP